MPEQRPHDSGPAGTRDITSVRRVHPWLAVGGLATSLVFSYIAVRNVDFEVFVDALGEGTFWWVAPSLAALAAAVGLRLFRWRRLFGLATRPQRGAALRALLIGELFNSVLPMRAGELARIVALHREAGTSRSEALGTTVVERLADVVVLLLVLFAALPFLPEITWLGAAMLLFGLVALGAVATMLALQRYGARAFARLLRPLARLPGLSVARTDAAAENLLRGVRGVRDLRTATVTLVSTLLAWVAVAVAYWLAMLGLDVDAGFEAAGLIVVATTFSLLIPSLPGSLGVFEAAVVVSLQPFGVDESRALSVAVVLHVISFAPFILVGLVALHSHPATRRRLDRSRSGRRT